MDNYFNYIDCLRIKNTINILIGMFCLCACSSKKYKYVKAMKIIS